MHSSTEVEWDVPTDGPSGGMQHAVAKLRASGQWPGPIMIESLATGDRPPWQLLMPAATGTDVDRLVRLLTTFKVAYEVEARCQRVATATSSAADYAIAASAITIDSGVNPNAGLSGTFWFDRRGKFLSHALHDHHCGRAE
jgi:hypothetical protein